MHHHCKSRPVARYYDCAELMGIENRDYYRESNPYTDRLSGWGIVSIPPVCKWIIIANIAVFVLQIFVTREPTNEDVAAHKKQIEEVYKSYGVLDRHNEKLTDEERAEQEQAELEMYKMTLGRMSYVEDW